MVLPARVALLHHVGPLGVHQPCRVGMVLEYSPIKVLAWAAFMHNDNTGHIVLMRHALLKGLSET